MNEYGSTQTLQGRALYSPALRGTKQSGRELALPGVRRSSPYTIVALSGTKQAGRGLALPHVIQT